MIRIFLIAAVCLLVFGCEDFSKKQAAFREERDAYYAARDEQFKRDAQLCIDRGGVPIRNCVDCPLRDCKFPMIYGGKP
jgi:hypothetical protein